MKSLAVTSPLVAVVMFKIISNDGFCDPRSMRKRLWRVVPTISASFARDMLARARYAVRGCNVLLIP